MADTLHDVAPAFVEMAHRIVWATAATVDTAGNPSTRILHPVWQWDGSALTGWIATSPKSLKARHLERLPRVSLTYWQPNHDTCSAMCTTGWELSEEQRRDGWQRFAEAPAPVGYDPSIVPGWDSPQAPAFGILRLEPVSLRVMDGARMLGGPGRLLTWRATG
jgi:Pyridoxamine 5'-phosphate oxidase